MEMPFASFYHLSVTREAFDTTSKPIQRFQVMTGKCQELKEVRWHWNKLSLVNKLQDLSKSKENVHDTIYFYIVLLG